MERTIRSDLWLDTEQLSNLLISCLGFARELRVAGVDRMNEASAGGLETLILQLVPLVVTQAPFVVAAFFISKKRGVNPWPWTIAASVPVLGIFVGFAFSFVMLATLFERLRDLEDKAS